MYHYLIKTKEKVETLLNMTNLETKSNNMAFVESIGQWEWSDWVEKG